jgi:hypothetical protein
MILKKRMYFLVAYQLNGTQGGIQSGHAALEYAHLYKNDEDYIDFLENNKTWIILNGGTTNDDDLNKGTINKDVDLLNTHNIKHTIFREPDLGNVITAVCLIADERVFDKETYPDFFFISYSNWLNKPCNYKNSIYSHVKGEKNEYTKSIYEYLKEKDYDLYVKQVGVEVAILKKILNNKVKF